MRVPEGQLHGPGAFIPAAERYQLASRIDRWVLRSTLGALKGRPRLEGIARVAINLSGQSVGDRSFHRFALEAIEASGLPADRLCVEITETAVVANLADAAHFISELHALGVQVALDDFGAGSASFGYLKTLKVDVLKIDGQFVRGLLQGELESAALRSFVDVARVLDLRSVAEQVESEAVAMKLAQLGVDFGQGYFFHRPEPFADLLSTWGTGADSLPWNNVIRAKFGSRDD
jgi:EAL domain-containing protein (putative c-di-GMP-specific phosphodiesterase class I)